MLVKDYMREDPVTLKPDDSFRDAMEKLKERHIRHLPVVDGKKLVGIVTDRDIRAASASSATTLSIYELQYLLDKIKVREIMNKNVITATPQYTIEKAAWIMHEKKIGALPVVDEKELVGIITETDLLGLFSQMLGLGTVSSRIEVEMEDRPGMLARVAALFGEMNINIMSVVSAPSEKEGKRNLIFRLNYADAGKLREELEKAGYEVVDARTSD